MQAGGWRGDEPGARRLRGWNAERDHPGRRALRALHALLAAGGGGGGDASVTATPIRSPRRHTWAVAPAEATQQRLRAATECLQDTPAGLPNTFARAARAMVREGFSPDAPAAADERVVVDEILS